MMNSNNTPLKQAKNTFTSYLNCTKALNGTDDDIELKLKPKLLSGEIEVASAPVCMYPPASNISDENGIIGLLVITNFKLSFLPLESIGERESYQENTFLGKHDVTLNNIDIVYQITDKKRKRLQPQQKISSKIEALHIVCKNFRLLKFNFRGMARDQGKRIASALAKFAFPTRHDLSFAYCFKENYYNTLRSTVTMFNNKNDWTRELIRCGATEWRVLSAEAIEMSHLLPPHFIIPKCTTIEKFIENARAFYDNRSAFWVYGYGNASLVRMAELMPHITDTSVENVTLELVRKCDPDKKSLKIMNLHELLPSIQDVQRGFLKFREICTPDTPRQFILQDSKYYSLLDKSSWLLYVSLCLKFSAETAENLRCGTTVVLRENNARDMCCVISSLTQLLLDPFFRSIDGYQTLIQKEWIALEHPFNDRLGHVVRSEIDEECPLFLLFLDCTWQLLQQFPEEFEFSQTYLTTVWDSAFMPIFDTFQFNTEYERHQATKDQKLTLRPVWDWNEQFADKDKIFFTNPFYTKRQEYCRKTIVIPANAILLPGLHKPSSRFSMDPRKLNVIGSTAPTIPKDKYLEPRCGISDLEIWEQCYYRWTPILEIKNGGYPQIELFHRIILSNISKLQRAIDTGDYDDLPDEFSSITSATNCITKNSDITPTNSPLRQQQYQNLNHNNQLFAMPKVNSFFPFSTTTADSSQLTEILTNSNELLMEGSIMDRLSIAQLPD